jgi:hypothetical protein
MFKLLLELLVEQHPQSLAQLVIVPSVSMATHSSTPEQLYKDHALSSTTPVQMPQTVDPLLVV